MPSVSLVIPTEVRALAKEGTALVARGYSGGTHTGRARGHQLSAGGRISMHDAMVMRAWFARHYRTSRPTYLAWVHATAAERAQRRRWNGAVAWLLWGGDQAYRWITGSGMQDAIVAWGARHGKHLKRRVDAPALGKVHPALSHRPESPRSALQD